MLFENLLVGRVVMHEVLKRGEDRSALLPIYATAIENLPANAMAQFRLRVLDALSPQSKSMAMKLNDIGGGSFVALAEALVDADDEQFLTQSCGVADKLAAAQMARGIPGGVVIVFDGLIGTPGRRFLGVIKAETQSGFRRNRNPKKSITEFLDDIFLTPAQRLYKIGLLIEATPGAARANAWQAFVFDHNITSSHRESAAQYFYEHFMGCTFPEDGPYETARFFDLTKEFVRKTPLPPEERRDLNDALYTFIRTEKAPTFTSQEFADKYLPLDLRDPFKKHLDSKQFPSRAVVRDTSDMGTRLRRRKFRFGGEIEISVSPEALQDKRVTMQTAPAHEFDGEGDARWTQVIIRHAMTDQL